MLTFCGVYSLCLTGAMRSQLKHQPSHRFESLNNQHFDVAIDACQRPGSGSHLLGLRPFCLFQLLLFWDLRRTTCMYAPLAVRNSLLAGKSFRFQHGFSSPA